MWTFFSLTLQRDEINTLPFKKFTFQCLSHDLSFDKEERESLPKEYPSSSHQLAKTTLASFCNSLSLCLWFTKKTTQSKTTPVSRSNPLS